MKIILFVVVGVVFALAYNKHKKKSEIELKETIREEIKEALKEHELEMFNDFDDFDPFEPQDDESDNLHKIVEKDIDDLEYTIRKEMKNNE